MTKVVNIKTDKYDIFIGRPSEYGNPFLIGRDGNRDEVCAKYQDYFDHKIATDKNFYAAVMGLKDKTLGCFCKKKNKQIKCHGDTIANYLNSL